MNKDKKQFLENELFKLTLAAMTQHNPIYKPNVRPAARKALHKTLHELLRQLVPQYKVAGIHENKHTKNILWVATTISKRHRKILNGKDGKFKIGSAQKALNLYLKYQWCIGEIQKPPHCPFDAFILKELAGLQSPSWTQIDSTTDYRNLVFAAKKVAGKRPLADWELSVYNAARQS